MWHSVREGRSLVLPSFAVAWNSDVKAGAAAAILGHEVISQWKTQARKLSTKVREI